MKLYGDGWYALREDAEEALAYCVAHGAKPVGIVESKWETWGILYYSPSVLFDNHQIDKDSAFWHAANDPVLV